MASLKLIVCCMPMLINSGMGIRATPTCVGSVVNDSQYGIFNKSDRDYPSCSSVGYAVGCDECKSSSDNGKPCEVSAYKVWGFLMDDGQRKLSGKCHGGRCIGQCRYFAQGTMDCLECIGNHDGSRCEGETPHVVEGRTLGIPGDRQPGICYGWNCHPPCHTVEFGKTCAGCIRAGRWPLHCIDKSGKEGHCFDRETMHGQGHACYPGPGPAETMPDKSDQSWRALDLLGFVGSTLLHAAASR